MAKIKRHKKEVAIQRAMAGCLRERRYEVASWQKVRNVKPQEPQHQATE
jgi:hypothetical protein